MIRSRLFLAAALTAGGFALLADPALAQREPPAPEPTEEAEPQAEPAPRARRPTPSFRGGS